jgi:hypothetical protein
LEDGAIQEGLCGLNRRTLFSGVLQNVQSPRITYQRVFWRVDERNSNCIQKKGYLTETDVVSMEAECAEKLEGESGTRWRVLPRGKWFVETEKRILWQQDT